MNITTLAQDDSAVKLENDEDDGLPPIFQYRDFKSQDFKSQEVKFCHKCTEALSECVCGDDGDDDDDEVEDKDDFNTSMWKHSRFTLIENWSKEQKEIDDDAHEN